MKIIDSHTHLDYGNPEKLLGMAERFGYERFNVLSIPCHGNLLNNLECLLMKKLAPEKVYVYGGVTWLPGGEARGEDVRKELELLTGAGCDGWKLLESKPSVYRKLKIPLDGPALEEGFAFAEEAGLPIIWHSGDPATFWDASLAPAFAVENHWLCIGEGYPALEEMDRQVEQVLTRHPRLKVTLAHLFFTSDRREYGVRMLDRYENLFFDLTPGSEMYWEFLKDPDYWGGFFDRYQDRLIYGTDMVDDEGDVVFGSQAAIVDLVMNTLCESKPYALHGHSGTGLGLPESQLRKIMRENFLGRNGDPRPLDEAGVCAYAAWLMDRLPAEDRVRAEALLKRF